MLQKKARVVPTCVLKRGAAEGRAAMLLIPHHDPRGEKGPKILRVVVALVGHQDQTTTLCVTAAAAAAAAVSIPGVLRCGAEGAGCGQGPDSPYGQQHRAPLTITIAAICGGAHATNMEGFMYYCSLPQRRTGYVAVGNTLYPMYLPKYSKYSSRSASSSAATPESFSIAA